MVVVEGAGTSEMVEGAGTSGMRPSSEWRIQTARRLAASHSPAHPGILYSVGAAATENENDGIVTKNRYKTERGKGKEKHGKKGKEKPRKNNVTTQEKTRKKYTNKKGKEIHEKT